MCVSAHIIQLDLAGQSSITAGATGGAAGETVHTIAGVATVTASNPVYDDGVYYNMDNLFDGDTSPTDVHDTYWMAQNEAETTLTFRFPAALELSRVSLGRGYAVILHKTDCKNGDLFSKLPFLNCHFCHFLHIKRKRDEKK